MRACWIVMAVLALVTARVAADEDKAHGLPEETLQQRESLPKVKLSAVPVGNMKLTGESGFTVEDEVCLDGLFYRFLVRAPHGDYDVISIRKLGKTLGEIEVFEKYRATEQGSQAWKGAKDSVKELGQGLKAIVTSPGDSAKAMGRGIARLGRSIGRMAQKPFEDSDKTKAGDGTDRSRGAQAFIYSDELRKFAFELGVDVYSDNVYLQALMREVAKRRAAGRIATSISMSAMSLGTYGTVLQGALTPGGLDQQAEIDIRDNDPGELKHINKKQWKADMGMDKDKCEELKRLLDNPNYTPRESTYARVHFTRMKGIEGLLSAINTAGSVGMPNEAEAIMAELELISAYHMNQGQISRFVPVGGLIAAQEQQGALILILPYDILGGDETLLQVIASLSDTAKQLGARAEIWGTGVASPAFVQAAKNSGIAVEQKVLLKPCFNAK